MQEQSQRLLGSVLSSHAYLSDLRLGLQIISWRENRKGHETGTSSGFQTSPACRPTLEIHLLLEAAPHANSTIQAFGKSVIRAENSESSQQLPTLARCLTPTACLLSGPACSRRPDLNTTGRRLLHRLQANQARPDPPETRLVVL